MTWDADGGERSRMTERVKVGEGREEGKRTEGRRWENGGKMVGEWREDGR